MPFAHVKHRGQGRGRTADLPIFRTPVLRSYSIGTVFDLRRKIHAVIDERRRTNANETEIETTRAYRPLGICWANSHRPVTCWGRSLWRGGLHRGRATVCDRVSAHRRSGG
jgi:hypothetical protein